MGRKGCLILAAMTFLAGVTALDPCFAGQYREYPRTDAFYIDTYSTDTELSTRVIGSKETAVGDLIADAVRSAAHADVAIVPAASFSEGFVIRPGTFTAQDLMKAVEYKTEHIGVVKLSGDQIRAALEHGLYLFPKSNSGLLQISGIVIVVNADADIDKKLVGIKVSSGPFVGSKIYRVAMPMTLANGALAYFKYWKKSDLEMDTGKTMESAIASYLVEHKNVTKGEARLVSKSKPMQ